jgi:hypothetical protein
MDKNPYSTRGLWRHNRLRVKQHFKLSGNLFEIWRWTVVATALQG